MWLGYGSNVPAESGQWGCVLIAEVRVETRNIFELLICESLLLHGLQIFIFI